MALGMVGFQRVIQCRIQPQLAHRVIRVSERLGLGDVCSPKSKPRSDARCMPATLPALSITKQLYRRSWVPAFAEFQFNFLKYPLHTLMFPHLIFPHPIYTHLAQSTQTAKRKNPLQIARWTIVRQIPAVEAQTGQKYHYPLRM